MEADGQVDLKFKFGKIIDSGNQAAGGNGDVTGTYLQTFGIIDCS
jgi:hypothetical protein